MKKTVVLGLGISGLAAAKFLVQQGVSVIGIDRRCSSEEGRSSLASLQTLGVDLQPETSSLDWTSIQELVVSPGISPHHPLYAEALHHHIPITAEAELALPHLHKTLVAITGTNGKTTVTLLVEHILNQAGISAKALGNVGVALCDYLLHPGPEEVCVIELSSYQLEAMRTPVFKSAVLLNITPDHLDRYPDMRSYAQAKCHLETLVKGEFFVQKTAALEYRDLLRSTHLFGWDHSCDLWTDQVSIFEGEKVVSVLPMTYKKKGRHDCENALAAWVLCRSLGCSAESFVQGLETFQKPPHRIEWVKDVKGVSYYDDSKGTNVDAVIQAVGSMPSTVVLIAGGVDKGSSYLSWKEPFLHKVKHIIVIGQAAEKIQRELNPYFAVTCVESLEKAVHLSADLAKKGECVLLSPGCSSFDLFRDYAHRGEEFQKHVKKLI